MSWTGDVDVRLFGSYAGERIFSLAACAMRVRCGGGFIIERAMGMVSHLAVRPRPCGMASVVRRIHRRIAFAACNELAFAPAPATIGCRSVNVAG